MSRNMNLRNEISSRACLIATWTHEDNWRDPGIAGGKEKKTAMTKSGKSLEFVIHDAIKLKLSRIGIFDRLGWTHTVHLFIFRPCSSPSAFSTLPATLSPAYSPPHPLLFSSSFYTTAITSLSTVPSLPRSIYRSPPRRLRAHYLQFNHTHPEFGGT